MNKFINQSVIKDFARNNKDDLINDDNSELAWNYKLIDIDELSNLVVDMAKESFRSLEKGLPVSVYQLKLFNVLTKQGLSLKSVKSTAKNETIDHNEGIISVNDVLIIQYVNESNVQYQNEKQVKKYINDNNYAVALIIQIKQNNLEITKVDQYCIAH